MERWTRERMRELAKEEREELGLTKTQRLDPYDLAAHHGIAVYELSALRSSDLSDEAYGYFASTSTSRWSAMLVPFGSARVIVENDSHSLQRRRSSIGHELGHHLLEHPFNGVLLGDDHQRSFDAVKERQATFLAGELLVPDRAAYLAARAGWSNAQVADQYGVSEQFAQMQMKGPRVIVQRALNRARNPTSSQ